LTGLEPNTRYYYQVGVPDNGTSEVMSFQTKDGNLVFAVSTVITLPIFMSRSRVQVTHTFSENFGAFSAEFFLKNVRVCFSIVIHQETKLSRCEHLRIGTNLQWRSSRRSLISRLSSLLLNSLSNGGLVPGLSLHTSQVAHQAGAYSGFCNMKRLGVFLLPPGWDASPSQG